MDRANARLKATKYNCDSTRIRFVMGESHLHITPGLPRPKRGHPPSGGQAS